MAHERTNQEIRETAALYALGALEDERAGVFASHIVTCPVCAQEVRSFRRAAERLDEAIAPAAPPSSLRERVLAQVRAARGGAPPPSAGAQSLAALADALIVRAADGDWDDLCPGVRMRTLFEDASTGRKTALVRMQPGASVQPHRHAGVEEVFILEGDCHVSREQVLLPGDYYRAEAGTVHAYTYSEQGTLFLSVFNNEFLPEDIVASD